MAQLASAKQNRIAHHLDILQRIAEFSAQAYGHSLNPYFSQTSVVMAWRAHFVPAPALDRLSACLQGCRDESRHGTHERVRHIIEPHVRNAD
ncbi:MAG: hypothetical protein ABSH32_31380 [Bryobacteraceae bacterium]